MDQKESLQEELREPLPNEIVTEPQAPVQAEDSPKNEGGEPEMEQKPAQEEQPKKKGSLGREIWWFLRPTVIACLLLLIVSQFFIMYAHVPTSSMCNTILEDSYIFANRRAYDSITPQRGDVIVFETEESRQKYLVKRVVGVAGDHIELIDGDVYLNGSLYEESYVTSKTYPLHEEENVITEYTVPEGCVFVLGDNREFSVDARQWRNPYLPVENIRGKVFCTFSIAKWYFRSL